MSSVIFWVLLGLAIVSLLYVVDIRLWMAALSSGVPVSLGALIGMRMRRVSPRAVVIPLIKARKSGRASI